MSFSEEARPGRGSPPLLGLQRDMPGRAGKEHHMSERERYQLADIFLLLEELWYNADERRDTATAAKLENILCLVEEFFPEDTPF